LNSTSKSPIVEVYNNPSIDLMNHNNDNMLYLIQRKIEYIKNVTISIDELRKVLDYHVIVLLDYNIDNYIALFMECCHSNFPIL
jgi:hypothetical protein